jgi:predicted nuclease with TOPRIM domain
MDERTSTTDGNLQALRDQVRDTSERLHKAEIDNNALRERLALRNTQLEEINGKLLAMRRSDAELNELRTRVATAERRAAEMEHEVERIETELDDTASRFHLTKLSEALREMDNEVIVEEDDELYIHPRLIIGQSAER